MTQREGRLIVFEGIDGGGKSTQLQTLAERLASTGREVVCSREPTRGPHGMALRRSMAEGRLDPDEELRLFLADRREHVETLIAPALARGALVLLDRYYFSTVAYQGARGLDQGALLSSNEAFAPAPDLLVILDLDPEDGLTRVRKGRGQTPDTFEVPELLTRSRQIFLTLAARLPYAHVIDALNPAEDVSAAIYEHVEPLL